MAIKRLDKTFLKLLKKELSPPIYIDIKTDYYTIYGPMGKPVILEVIACIRRPYEDHKEMLEFIKWRLSLEEKGM